LWAGVGGQLTGCYTVEAVGEDKASARLITAARKKKLEGGGNLMVVTQGGQDDNPSRRMTVERPVTILTLAISSAPGF
jgi:hypothetical protein